MDSWPSVFYRHPLADVFYCSPTRSSSYAKSTVQLFFAEPKSTFLLGYVGPSKECDCELYSMTMHGHFLIHETTPGTLRQHGTSLRIVVVGLSRRMSKRRSVR
ncbi:hypothetical protein PTI98_004029 [Pleurotus ostreatus]|nr:hypothetical protein PTI98_004029 [Pleurotus ostreatus]